MEPLSNLDPARDLQRGGAAPSIHLRPVQRSEIHRCLELILGVAGRAAAEEQVVDFLRYAVYRAINLNDIWLAERAGKILWAILPVVSPGRTMLLFTPSHVPADILDTAICPLVERVLQHFAGRAIELAQVLIDPADAHAVELFEQCNFTRLAELIYLDREVRRAHLAALPAGFRWETYSQQTHAEFARTIQLTYHNSLDCPALNGRRQIEDVIAGHKAAGEFDPTLWFLLRDEASAPTAVGVLLLNRSPRTEALELVYLGLIAPARGRAIGDIMMKHALAMTSAVGSRRLTLAVDSRNVPALRLYHRHGLTRVCSRMALLRDLRPPAVALKCHGH